MKISGNDVVYKDLFILDIGDVGRTFEHFPSFMGVPAIPRVYSTSFLFDRDVAPMHLANNVCSFGAIVLGLLFVLVCYILLYI